MNKVLVKNKSILGLTFEYETFYLGTIMVVDELMHLLSKKENLINFETTYAVSDENFNRYCKII